MKKWLWNSNKSCLINLQKVNYFEIQRHLKTQEWQKTENGYRPIKRYVYNIVAVMENGDKVWLKECKNEEEARRILRRLAFGEERKGVLV